MPKIYNTHSIFDAQINELFSKPKDTEMDIILKTLSLIIYSNSTNTDLVELYKTLSLSDFIKVISIFDGKLIKLPTSQEMKDNLILAMVYYFREVEKLSWDEVKEKLPFEISGISLGIKLKNLNNFIQQKLNELFKKVEE